MFLRLAIMRSIVALFCTSLAVALMGASTPTMSDTPTIIIFALRQPEGLDPQAGLGYAVKLGSAIEALGGVKVIMGDPATQPADYLKTAKAAGSDFYLMGSVAPPIKDSVAVVEQVVSTRTGIVTWSNTAYVSSVEDVNAQAPSVKSAITAYETRGFQLIFNPTPVPVETATPGSQKKRVAVNQNPSAGNGDASHGDDQPPLKLPNEDYGYSSKPTAPPKVYASATHPSRFVVLTFVGKNVTPAIRDYAVDSLIKALERHGQSAAEGDPESTGRMLPSVDLCASTGAAYLVFGSVSGSTVQPNEYSQWIGRSNASIALATYDCAGQKFVQTAKQVGGQGTRWEDAVDRAANSAVTNYLLKVTTVAKSS